MSTRCKLWHLHVLIFKYNSFSSAFRTWDYKAYLNIFDVTEWLRLEGTSGSFWPTSVQARTLRARSPGPHPGSFQSSPLTRPPQVLWASSASAQHNSASWWSYTTLCSCLFPVPLVLERRRAWLCLHFNLPPGICIHQRDPLSLLQSRLKSPKFLSFFSWCPWDMLELSLNFTTSCCPNMMLPCNYSCSCLISSFTDNLLHLLGVKTGIL